MVEKIKCVVAPEFMEVEQWVDRLPVDFARLGETIYKFRNEIKVFTMGNQQFNVKAFKVPNLINRIVYQYFRSPKSARSYHYARKFIILGIQTPTPVGHVECSENGLFSKSFYVSLHLNYNYTLKEVLDFPDKQKKDILRKWIHFTYEKLHKNGIFHLDYSPGNTLITENNGEYQFSIVDLNRLSFRKINFEYGLRNFSRLGVDQAIFEFVGSEYAMIRGQNPEKGAHLMVEIDRKCNKKLEKKDLLKEILKWVLRYGRDEKLAS